MRSIFMVLSLLPLAAGAACLQSCEWYAVKENGALTTRPAYTLVAGGLIKSKVRAPVGATCNLNLPSKQRGKDVYASWDASGTVALCSKR